MVERKMQFDDAGLPFCAAGDAWQLSALHDVVGQAAGGQSYPLRQP